MPCSASLVSQWRAAAREIAGAGAPASLLGVVDLLATGPVRTAAEAAAAVQAAGLSDGPVHPSCLTQAWWLFGRDAPGWQLKAVGGIDVLVPDRHAVTWQTLEAHVRRVIATSSVAGVAAEGLPGLTAAAVIAALAADPTWVVHQDPGSTAAAGRCWVWRRAPAPSQRGLVAGVVLRLLAARHRPLHKLPAARVDAVAALPPVVRRDAAVPPARILHAWLVTHVPRETRRGGRGLAAAGDLVPGFTAADLGAPGRLDMALLDAVASGGGSATRGQLRTAITAAGWTPASAATLVGRSPVVRRAGRDNLSGALTASRRPDAAQT